MDHPLDSPSLYKRCFRFAMALVRGWPNREEEAQDIVHDGYILAIRSTSQWKPEEISFEQWVIRKVRDAWRKWVERRSALKRSLISSMVDSQVRDEDGKEADPEIVVPSRQENLTYLKELAAGCNHFQRRKLAAELGRDGEVCFRNNHASADWWDAERRDAGEAINRCEPDLWAKRVIARCDLRWPRKDRPRARPVAA